jgi:hypothetical protein
VSAPAAKPAGVIASKGCFVTASTARWRCMFMLVFRSSWAWTDEACEAGGGEVEGEQGGEAPADQADVGGQSEHEAGNRDEGE